MSLTDFLLILVFCSITMWLCRVVPLLVLKGRELSPAVVRALGFIPPAAFAALVANDLFKPDAFSADPWAWAAQLLAAVIVIVLGVKTKSMLWCIVVGVGALALFTWAPLLF